MWKWELLTHEDRAELERLLEAGMDTRDRKKFCLSLVRTLRIRESSGNKQAGRIVDAMGYHGVYLELGKLAKKPTSVFKDSATGRVLNYPKVGGIPVTRRNGTKTGARQLKIWEEMTRMQFEHWLDQQTHHMESLRFKVHGLNRVLAAWETFPHALTAGQACMLAGIDPDEIEFEYGGVNGHE